MAIKWKKRDLKPHDTSGFLYRVYKLWEIWQIIDDTDWLNLYLTLNSDLHETDLCELMK